VKLTDAERTHLTLLEKWRRAMDLVGPGPLEPHFEDAALAVRGLPEGGGRWADLGSGAGFPGVALAARYPGLQVELVESRQKRATFLKEVVHRAGLTNARVLNIRSEQLEDGSYDGVISRAYRQPPAYLADAARLLRPGGIAVLLAAGGEPPEGPPLMEVFHVQHYEVDGRPRRVAHYRRA
jgi:16S rRNA (guanine527-N7)-methyltransferase